MRSPKNYIAKYYESVLVHYEVAGRHFDETAGYEYYAKVAKGIGKVGEDRATKGFVDLQIWGTPDQCFERIMDIRHNVGNDAFERGAARSPECRWTSPRQTCGCSQQT